VIEMMVVMMFGMMIVVLWSVILYESYNIKLMSSICW